MCKATAPEGPPDHGRLAAFMVNPGPLSADDVIGGYELLRRIGKGGMAEVWLGRKADAAKAGKTVAVKLIAPHLAGQERYSRMFRAEAELSAMLTHSNIVQVFDEGEERGISYLVMEFVDGINLVRLREALKLLGDDAFKHQLVAYVIGQLLHALSYAHNLTLEDGRQLRLVHRDVSPQNVLISNAGDVKLTDFGVAHTMFEETSGVHVKGKVRYMAPEQLAGKSKDPAIDLYAAGAILHELLDGEKFRGEFDDERVLHAQVLAGAVPRLMRPVPAELERVRLALLEPDERRRVPTADDAIRLLSAFPGYRDMRMELSKICGSLTGVVRPRVGAHGSSGGTPRPSLARAYPTPSPMRGTPLPSTQRTEQVPLAQLDTARLRPPSSRVPTPSYLPQHRTPTPAFAVYEEPTATSTHNHGSSSFFDERRDAPTMFPGQDKTISDTEFTPWEPRRPSTAKFVVIGLLLAFGGAAAMTAVVLGRQERHRASTETAQGEAERAEAPQIVLRLQKPEVAVGDPPPPVDDATRSKGTSVPVAAAGAPASLATASETPSGPAEPDARGLDATASATPTAAPDATVSSTAIPESSAPEATASSPPRTATTRTAASRSERPKPRATSSSTVKRCSADGPPLRLYLRLDGVSRAFAKIDGEVHEIDGRSSIVLAAGGHQISYGPTSSGPWTRLGCREMAGGDAWQLRVGPASASLGALR